MIHELQSFDIALFILASLAVYVYGMIVLTRQTDWRVVPNFIWRHPFYAPFILVWNLPFLEFAWLAFGLTIEGFGGSHFMQGFFYNSTLNGMEYIFKVPIFLWLVLWIGELGYIHGLKPLVQKVKAAMKL